MEEYSPVMQYKTCVCIWEKRRVYVEVSEFLEKSKDEEEKFILYSFFFFFSLLLSFQAEKESKKKKKYYKSENRKLCFCFLLPSLPLTYYASHLYHSILQLPYAVKDANVGLDLYQVTFFKL